MATPPPQRDWRTLPACPSRAPDATPCPHDFATTLHTRPWCVDGGRATLYVTRLCVQCGQVCDKPVRARLF